MSRYHQSFGQGAGYDDSSSDDDDDEVEESESSSDDDEPTITLYHHTDKDSAIRIVASKYIKQSKGSGDAAFGYGVYLTEVGHTSSRSVVAKNNYTKKGRWEKKIRQGKTDVAIKIKIKQSCVEMCDSSRNIYIYRGDLHLDNVENWRVYVRDD